MIKSHFGPCFNEIAYPLAHIQIQYLLTWAHNSNADKSGLFAFNELLVTLRAVPVEYPGGRLQASAFDVSRNKQSSCDGNVMVI